jgi:hypothetical protein
MGFHNVTRKNTIRSAVVVVVVGAIAIAFWPTADEGELRFKVSAASSNSVSLVFTNSRKTSIDYYISQQAYPVAYYRPTSGTKRKIPGRSAEIIELAAFSTNRWRYVVTYASAFPNTSDSSNSWFFELRANVARHAWNHDWKRISQWVTPWPPTKTIVSREMLGNQPTPPRQ